MNAPLRARKRNQTIVYALLALLVISLTGFGVRSVGSGRSQTIASVGEEKVTVATYIRTLQAQLQQLSQRFGTNISYEQARLFGLDSVVLGQVLQTAALDGETRRLGLSVGDAKVKETLLANPAFQGLTGGFDQGAYNEALLRANLKPAEFDEMIRGDNARAMLNVAIAGGIQVNDTFAMAMFDYVAEKRDFLWAPVTAEMLDGANRTPSDAEIEAEYKANPEAYRTNLTRRITYIDLLPEDVLASIEVDEQALLDLYEANKDHYVTPERRIVDRLVYPNPEAASAALLKVTGGTADFDDLVAERNLTLEDVDLGEVSRADLTAAAADAVFGLDEPGLVGPVESELGPAIYRVNAILDAVETTFDEARDELRIELVADRARRQIDERVTEIDDLLAAGATLEEIADETPMKLGQIDYVEGEQDGIAGYEEFRDAAEAVASGDFPKVISLADGGIFALRLNEIVEPAQIPLAEARDSVVANWNAAETRRRLLELAAALEEKLRYGGGFAAMGLDGRDATGITREGFVEGATDGLVAQTFTMHIRDVATVDDGKTIALVHLTGIAPFDPATDENRQLVASLSARLSQDVGADVFEAFIRALQDEAGITVNQQLIAAVATQIR